MQNDVIIFDPSDLEIHELANENRPMSSAEFSALKKDIEQNGQIMPVLLYRGKIVDGKHRRKALIELGSKQISAIRLPNNIMIDDVRRKVIGTEIRRTDNVAQRAIKAYNWVMLTGDTQGEAGSKFFVGQVEVSRAKKLLEQLGESIYRKFWRDGYIFIGGKKVSTLRSALKMIEASRKNRPEQEPLSSGAKDGFELLQSLVESDDKVAIAQIEMKAKEILKNWD